MSPAVVALSRLARSFSTDLHEDDDAEQQQTADTAHSDQTDQPLKSKSRSSSFNSAANESASSPRYSPLYHYDPYHQYCRTGSDFYKSYHLSYQAYSHSAKSKFSTLGSGASRPPVEEILKQHSNTKLANARARAARLRRKISEFRVARASTRIQRLALATVTVTILAFIFSRTLIPAKIPEFISPTQFRRGVISYSKSLAGLVTLGEDLSVPSGFCENGSLFGVDKICNQQPTKSEPVLQNLFGPSPGSSTPEDLPNIARHVFLKFYALAFLALIVFVSFVCERLFGRKFTAQHEGIFTSDDDEEEIDVDEEDLEELDVSSDDEDEVDGHIGSYAIDDLYWDCEPTKMWVPKLPLHKLGVKPPQMMVNDLKISILFYLLPLRLISRIWGWMNGVQLPVRTRRPLYLWYSRTFGCNLDEMLIQDLEFYRNLGEFFRRTLKPGVRPIGGAHVVSPADGRVVQLEPISTLNGYVGSVKGIHYSLENFLGTNAVPTSLRPGNRLYSCVVYLAPGDYHRFHSPANWTVHRRRHFSGRLLSVKPSFVAQVPNLFSVNERVVYLGEWEQGFFSMTAVGATNVGTVNVYFDPELQTNKFALSLKYHTDKCFSGIQMSKGELFGEFNLGSTIVLVYEAADRQTTLPNDAFRALLDQKIKYGEDIHET